MNFRHFVNNPVKVAMLFLAIVLMGGLSYRKLPLNLFPDLETPRVTVLVSTRSLTPEEVERRLTTDFERQLVSIKGVANVTSISRENSIVLHVDFHWDQDMEFAYLDVKKSVGTLENNENVESVEIYRFDPNAATFMTLAFVPDATDRLNAEPDGGEVDRVRLTSFVENSLKPKLETIKGVAYVKANGLRRQEVEILLDEDIMTQLSLTSDQVISAIRNYSSTQAGGVVIEGDEEMQLKFVSRFSDVNDVGQCVVTVLDNHPIRLKDLGAIRVAPSKDELFLRQDGVDTVGLDIYREPSANIVLTARRVREAVTRLNRQGGYDLKIAVDRSEEIEMAIDEVVRHALVGMVLAMAVLWLFLRNIFATLIVGVAIPISIIGTFCLMQLQGLSLNVMTLGGLALGAGMLVDNAIVVVENIFRRRTPQSPDDPPLDPVEAAVMGTREVAAAITASTLTTVVVFVPLVYVHGIAGILFKDQAMTVVYTLVVSLLVALILIPMLAARMAPARAARTGWGRRGYETFLAASLRGRWLVPFLFVLLLWLSWEEGQKIPSRFFPESANGQITMTLELPQGTPLERTKQITDRLEAKLLRLRWRHEGLGELLQAYEGWRISRDARQFFMNADVALGRHEAAISSPTASQGSRRSVDPDMIRSLKNTIFMTDATLGLDKLLAMAEEEADRAAGAGDPTRSLIIDKSLSDLNPFSQNAWERYRKRLIQTLDRLIIIRSITTSVGVESGSMGEASERIEGPHTARMDIILNPDVADSVSTHDIINLLRAETDRIPALECDFESRSQDLQQILGKNRGDIVVETHAEELPEMREAAIRAAQTLTDLPGLDNVRTNLILGEEACILRPDPDAMIRSSLKIDELANQIQAYLQGEKSELVKLRQGEMRILVKNEQAEREGLEGLMNLDIVSSTGQREKLRDLVDLRWERDIRDIMRVNQERTLLVMADLSGIDYSQAIGRVGEALDAMAWPPGAHWNFSGEEIQRRESFDRLLFALVIAIVLVYMVVASILESVIHPFTIMLSVPMALTGVVAAFRYTHLELNLMGLIGVVMLTGIVVNDAIVLLDRIRQIREGGDDESAADTDGQVKKVPVFEAVVRAGSQRLRPILMTSLTTILALAPLALGFGAGVELRRPMAVAVMGGLVTSTLLTLWLLPSFYVCVEDVLNLFRRLFVRFPKHTNTAGDETEPEGDPA